MGVEKKEMKAGSNLETARKTYDKPELTSHGQLRQIIRGTTGLFSDTDGPFPTPG